MRHRRKSLDRVLLKHKKFFKLAHRGHRASVLQNSKKRRVRERQDKRVMAACRSWGRACASMGPARIFLEGYLRGFGIEELPGFTRHTLPEGLDKVTT